MNVIDPLSAESHPAAFHESLRGKAFGLERIESAIQRFHRSLNAEALLHVLLRDDFCAGTAQHFIASDVINVPVGVENDANGMRVHLFGNGFEQIGGALRKSAVDHH